VKPDRVLVSGERVEIYRPLKADPKVVRRELAAMGKTMGRKRARKGQDPGTATTDSAEEG
jgi:putative ubiquitin-RnfH superfamily antitoxin RatB of RatAB toxin-antitoxin module